MPVNWRQVAVMCLGVLIGTGIAFGLYWTGSHMIADIRAQTAEMLANDAEVLCKPFGGVQKIGSRTYTVRNEVSETGLSVYCMDGSYVLRSINGKP